MKNSISDEDLTRAAKVVGKAMHDDSLTRKPADMIFRRPFNRELRHSKRKTEKESKSQSISNGRQSPRCLRCAARAYYWWQIRAQEPLYLLGRENSVKIRLSTDSLGTPQSSNSQNSK